MFVMSQSFKQGQKPKWVLVGGFVTLWTALLLYLQTREVNQSSHLILGKKANKPISQNVELLLLKVNVSASQTFDRVVITTLKNQM